MSLFTVCLQKTAWITMRLPKISILRNKQTLRSTVLLFSLLIIIFLIASSSLNTSGKLNSVKDSLYKGVPSSPTNGKLGKWTGSFFDQSMLEKEFKTTYLDSFGSNINIPESSKSKGKVAGNKENIRQQYDSASCKKYKYSNKFSYHISDNFITDDLLQVRNEIISWDNKDMTKLITQFEQLGLTDQQNVDKFWFEFGASPVWIESENCYVAYSRVISGDENREIYSMSLIKARAFDKDWNEIKEKRILYKDVIAPENLDEEIGKLDKMLDNSPCKEYKDDKLLYNECIEKLGEEYLNINKKREVLLDKYYIIYPRVLKFDFEFIEEFSGPEDPRVILKSDGSGEEPIIIFNMDQGAGRHMYSLFPHRKQESPLKFEIEGEKQRKIEKNWAPFFYKNIGNHNPLSKGFINFVYSLSPLEILQCSLDTGICKRIFGAKPSATLPDTETISSLRGATQFLPVPDVFPGHKNKNMWIAFSKIHLEKCGCGVHYYRPILTLLVETDGVFNLDLVSPHIDFGIEPYSWVLDQKYCTWTDVFSPNSIASWYVSKPDPKTNEITEYLTLTTNEADYYTRVINVKNLLKYISGFYENKDVHGNSPSDLLDETKKCIVSYARGKCKNYGRDHPEFDPKNTDSNWK